MDSRKKIYMDYNATTPLADEVVAAIHHSLVHNWANPSSTHGLGLLAKGAINKARSQIARMIHGQETGIVFTSGGTEANNMVICGVVPYFEEFKLRMKEPSLGIAHIITSNVEHDSVILAVKELERKQLAHYTLVKAQLNGKVRPEDIQRAIRPNTCLVTIMFANNETGVIMPIEAIAKLVADENQARVSEKLPKILFHTDAAQIIGKQTLNVPSLGVDYVTIVGHKFYGPRIGCVWARGPLFPLLFGGGQEGSLRPGTENTPMIVGLGAAAEVVSLKGEQHHIDLLTLRNHLEQQLIQEFGDQVVINCQLQERLANTTSVAFLGSGLTGRKVLDRCEMLVAGVGAACHGDECSEILLNSGVPASRAANTIRLSVGRSTTLEDIEAVVLDLKSAVHKVQMIQNVAELD